jgi:hypothetical protein
MEYKGISLEKVAETSEFSCDGCFFIHYVKKTVNVGPRIRHEYEEVKTGQRGCSAPNIEPFRSCKHEHVIFKEITKV